MTTIAANTKRMASDSRCVHGDRCFETFKIVKIGKDIIGAAGNADDCEQFLAWYEKKSKPIKFTDHDNFEALVLTPKGLFLYTGSLTPITISSPFYAVGSGSPAALGAMHMGASPERAIEVAIECNPLTGGKIVVLELDD